MGIITDKQVSFLRTLATERVTEAHQDVILEGIFDGTRPTASQEGSLFITMLLSAPRKPKATGGARISPWDAATQALADVTPSFYGIPAGYLAATGIDLYGNDYLFVVVRPYKGKHYLSRVSGAPGRPNYSKLTPAQCVSLASIMRGRHVEFAENWHRHSGRCGKCNAVLTDKASRDRGLGPECARQFA